MAERDLYDESTVEFVYRRGAWHDWYGMRRWIEREGEPDPKLKTAAIGHLAEDISALQQDEVTFTPDPHEAYVLLRRHCIH